MKEKDNVVEGDFKTPLTADDPGGETIEAELVGENKVPEPEPIKLVPIIQTCMLCTNHGRKIECKFWIHTDKYFQYFEPGYKVIEKNGAYMIEGDAVIVPNHEIQYVIIRGAQSAIPENMFLALGGKKKIIIGVPPIIGSRDK